MSGEPPSDPDASPRFTPRPDLLVEEIEDEVLILDPNKNKYFALNGVGHVIWRWLERGETFEALIDHLEETFEAPRDALTRDALAFLESLERNQLISPHPDR